MKLKLVVVRILDIKALSGFYSTLGLLLEYLDGRKVELTEI